MGTPHAIIHRDREIHFHEPVKIKREQWSGLGPAPETKTGIIACYTCSASGSKSYDDQITFTKHQYAGRKTVTSNEDVPLYHEIHYKCCKCGADRVWGTEEIAG